MKIEFPALQSEPLIYFLVHSGVFVLALGGLFFILGLWFGACIWGRYKTQAHVLRAENQGQREEIATLKRKLAEQGLRPSGGQSAPPAHLLTEIIMPSVGEIFPERQKHYPALAALPVLVQEPKVPESAEPPSADEAKPVPGAQKTTARKGTVKAKPKKEVPLPDPALTEPAEENRDLEPFSFLLAEPAEPEPQSGTSALSAIIKGSTTAQLTTNPAAESIPPSPEIAALPSLPEPDTAKPEVDPALGLIYKERPKDADDLTKIKGIASVLEKRLHELGIHTYRQIASWDEVHVREFSSRLAFKDRILREKWVEQARSLNEARQSA